MWNKTIKLSIIAVLVLYGLLVVNVFKGLLYAQDLPIRTHTTEEQLVSLSSRTSYQDAINILSKVAIRDEGKAIVDMTDIQGPINVEISSIYWKDALKRILSEKNLIFRESTNYYQIVSAEQKEEKEQAEKKEEDKYNTSTREVKINAIFFQADRTKSRQAGINWSVIQNAPGLTLDKLTAGFTFAGSEEQLQGGQALGQIMHSSADPDGQVDVEAVLNAFENMNLGKIISKPSIKVVDGNTGSIQVGKRFAVTQKDYAGNTVSKFVDAGTMLKVTPDIISDSGQTFIHLTINAEKSSAQTGLDRPEISTQNAKTDVLLVDGEQTVIGGLFTQDKQNVRNGIPILKDLPWWVLGIRYIAGSNQVTTTRKELIIFIQVELVKSLKERIAEKKEEMAADKYQKEINDFNRNVANFKNIQRAGETEVNKQKQKKTIDSTLKRDTSKISSGVSKKPKKQTEKKSTKMVSKHKKEPGLEKVAEEELKQKKLTSKKSKKESEEEVKIKEEKISKNSTQKAQKKSPKDKKSKTSVEEIKKPKETAEDSSKVGKSEEIDDFEETAETVNDTIQSNSDTTQEKIDTTGVKKKTNKVKKKESKVKQKPAPKSIFTVQIMETNNYENALVEASKIMVKGVRNRIELKIREGKSYYSVRSGNFDNYEEAKDHRGEIEKIIPDKQLEIYKIK
ncbi:MAG: SPOR domain-containing protein [Candidatus Marinimicrobia bacterium]|nr:SPOR domain-containing protein [Candidatus Neomarinimicrobiota bacterium]